MQPLTLVKLSAPDLKTQHSLFSFFYLVHSLLQKGRVQWQRSNVSGAHHSGITRKRQNKYGLYYNLDNFVPYLMVV